MAFSRWIESDLYVYEGDESFFIHVGTGGLAEDGKTFCPKSARECACEMIRLREMGYEVSEDAIREVSQLAARDAESFCLVQDNDCHWYVIPADRREAFDDWVRCQELGKPMETDLEPTPVNGSPCRVKFKQWEIE